MPTVGEVYQQAEAAKSLRQESLSRDDVSLYFRRFRATARALEEYKKRIRRDSSQNDIISDIIHQVLGEVSREIAERILPEHPDLNLADYGVMFTERERLHPSGNVGGDEFIRPAHHLVATFLPQADGPDYPRFSLGGNIGGITAIQLGSNSNSAVSLFRSRYLDPVLEASARAFPEEAAS